MTRSFGLGKAVKLVVSLGLLVWLLRRVSVGPLVQLFSRADGRWIAAALMLGLLGSALQAMQWRALLAALGLYRTIRRCLRLVFVGYLFNALLPSSVGGDVARALAVADQPAERGRGATTVILQRLCNFPGMVVLMAMGLVLSAGDPSATRARPLAALLVGVGTAGTALAMSSLPRRLCRTARLGRLPGKATLTRIGEALDSFRIRRHQLALASLRGTAFWGTSILNQWCYMRAVGTHPGLAYAAVIVTVVNVLIMLPISVNGYGLREGGFVALLALPGLATSTQAVAVGLSLGAQSLVFAAVGALVWLPSRRRGGVVTHSPEGAATVGGKRVLMISPHPVFTPRGTPIAVLNRCRALAALGHRVDLVTYPMGEDVEVPGLRWLRAPAVPGIRTVKVGPSLAKLPLNASVMLKTLAQIARSRYDVIHTHEEAGGLGWLLSRFAGIPHVYDMGNDFAVVLTNYGLPSGHPLTRLAGWLERRIVRSAAVTFVHFPELKQRVAEYAPGCHAELVYNVPLEPPACSAEVESLRREWSPDGLPIVLYAGTLESYQGIPTLLEAMARLQGWHDELARLVVVGGCEPQVDELRGSLAARALGDRLLFAGILPSKRMPACLLAADVLVSPRASGTNTPLKLFSYLGSGRPIVATRIRSHTQVLDDATALLVKPTAEGLASGIAAVLADPDLARRLGEEASRLARRKFSVDVFLARTAAAYARVGAGKADEAQLATAARRLDLEAQRC